MWKGKIIFLYRYFLVVEGIPTSNIFKTPNKTKLFQPLQDKIIFAYYLHEIKKIEC